ncbi:MAG: NYN domain-containing protein [SAR202 cluster bacterium]|nr:NYN domain-containing protein [SAR202 cluster bacterium]|tara:strand:- start:5149 stop:6138 length:990 start_codon:yes stop_codon:yes gene_type:complete
MVNSTNPNFERQVAVLIDFENVGLSSIQWLFDKISDIGRITIKRAYADWSTARSTREQVLQLGIEPVHLFHMASSGKNSSDIKLVIDSIDLLYQSPIDTFVIVSSDSDFVPLVSKLRSGGKTVIGAGRKLTASRALVISCDRYFYLDESTTQRNNITDLQQTRSSELLIRSVRSAMDEEGRVVGSKLRQTLQRLDPSFDFRTLGHATFTRYLESSPDVKISRPKGPGDIVVELLEYTNSINIKDTSSGVSTTEVDGEIWANIDVAWSKRASRSRSGNSMPGPSAAIIAAKVLGVSKLSSSKYKTLQKLLDSSEILSKSWTREGNSIIKV